MKVMTDETTVKNGQITRSEAVSLPENAKIYVQVPESEPLPRLHASSPRLARREDAADFVKEVAEEPGDAGRR